MKTCEADVGRARRAACRWIASIGLLGLVTGAAAGQEAVEDAWEPAKLLAGGLPLIPPLASGGGEVLLELEVDASGNVTDVSVLTDTPPFTSALVDTVRAWRFQPARDEEGPAASRVLVAALYREPAFYTGTSPGEPPRELATGSPETPHPRRLVAPPYPPQAYDSGSVLLAVRVDPSGDVEVETVSGRPGFQDAAADAVEQWEFRPARVEGEAVPSIAYAVVGFRQPVVR